MTDDTEYGALEGPGADTRLVFERRFEHPIERVWKFVDDPKRQAIWFPFQILGDRQPSARLRFVTSVDPDDGFDGTMVCYDPPHLIEMTWGNSRLRIELAASGHGTRLVLTEWLDDLGGAARQAAGWHDCLDRLAAIASDAVPFPCGVRWYQVHPHYVDSFPDGAALLGAPEGWADTLADDPYASRFDRHPEPDQHP